MRDWEATVRKRLGGLSLETEDGREVIAELASHLEETFEQLRQQGLPEDAAAERALSQVKNWQSLRRKIQMERSRENTMTKRVRQFWLPGFLTLLLSMVLLMVIQFIGPKPLIVGTHGWRMMTPIGVIYVPWLLSLLPIGAMGAYLAGRAGASQRTMFLSIIFPVLPYLALFAIAFPVSLVLDDHVAHNIMYEALLMGLLAWVVLPGIALLAGGLPTQIFLSR
jgi:hypothetical protein